MLTLNLCFAYQGDIYERITIISLFLVLDTRVGDDGKAIVEISMTNFIQINR